jgi:hypothetical protein
MLQAKPEDLERYREKWRVCFSTGEPFEDEARLGRAADSDTDGFLPPGDWSGCYNGGRTRVENRRERIARFRHPNFYAGKRQNQIVQPKTKPSQFGLQWNVIGLVTLLVTRDSSILTARAGKI